jgi:hypothetical protein
MAQRQRVAAPSTAGSLLSPFFVNPLDQARHVARRESHIPEHLLGARPAKVSPLCLEDQLVGMRAI